MRNSPPDWRSRVVERRFIPVEMTGLSPRVRGNLGEDGAGRGLLGSIPACAGEPPALGKVQLRRGVYPRVCGGTSRSTAAAQLNLGLSPRVRGNRPDPRHDLDQCGSIPACAGEPGSEVGCFLHRRVYPRVCGGTPVAVVEAVGGAGLSPRVRGNRERSGVVAVAAGSIPACAGEPKRRCRRYSVSWVYPRVCGGTVAKENRKTQSKGLSPRVRGNLPCRGRGRIGQGSIPACAGEPP